MKRTAAVDYTMIIVGSFIMAYAIKNIYDPVSLVTGGVSGIAIIAKEVAQIPLWITNTVLNTPLFLFAIKFKGWKFIRKTLVATIAMSLSLYLIPEAPILMDDLFLASLFGGIISGIGAGLVFLNNATTGGTDMLAALIQWKMKHYSIAQILQVVDAVVVLAGATIFGLRFALYALIAIYALAKVSDGMIEGLKFSKIAYIVSEKNEEIAKAVMERLERGVTGIDATGMYSGDRKKMLYCVVNKKEIIQIKEIVEEFDSNAFVIVSDAREVLGEGFIEYRQ